MVALTVKGTLLVHSGNAAVFLGHDHSPEGSAVWLSGNGDPWTDEEHNPVRRLRDQRIHQGKGHGLCRWCSTSVDSIEGLRCPLLEKWRNFLPFPDLNLNCVYLKVISVSFRV